MSAIYDLSIYHYHSNMLVQVHYIADCQSLSYGVKLGCVLVGGRYLQHFTHMKIVPALRLRLLLDVALSLSPTLARGTTDVTSAPSLQLSEND